MKVERFWAQDMAQAMSMIKARLGPDAVILHSRRVRRGILRRPWLEVIAAVDEDKQVPQDLLRVVKAVSARKELDAVRAELSALREAVARLAAEVRSADLPALTPSLRMIYSHLVARGLSEDLAAESVLAAASELNPAAADELETARTCVARHLHGRIITRSLTLGGQAGKVVL
ncbi:MAG: hypothetical protein J7M34_10775, partial [Anaerolineae bacterium]|nr:hypothetical protein [Anaerolineae bacterium]